MVQYDEPLSWKTLILTDENVLRLWVSLQQFPEVFDDFGKGDYNEFMSKLVSPTNVFIDIGDGRGVAAGFAVRPGVDTFLHLLMFDGKLRGREMLFHEIMGYFFRGLWLRRMTSQIVADNRTACKLVERLGFKLEGTMRNAVRGVDGKFRDVCMYGILREEFDAAIAQSTGSPADQKSA